MRLKLAFGGDVCLAGLAPDVGVTSIETCAALNRDHDVAIANLECCIVPDDFVHQSRMAVRASDGLGIADTGFDVFCLANNHMLDLGADVMAFTQAFLTARGIATVGVGSTARHAAQPLIIERAGARIAVINATDASHYVAQQNRAGVLGLSRRRLVRAVRAIRASVDLVVVCLHSDLEFTNYPAPWKVALSRALVRCGADLVIHHHPHTLQGIEEFNGGLIAYSLGNLVFPVHGRAYMERRDGAVDEGAVLSVTVEFDDARRPHISHTLLPVTIRADNATLPARAVAADHIRSRVAAYGNALRDETKIRQLHWQRCRSEGRRLLLGMYYALRHKGPSASLDVLWSHLRTRMHRNWLRGLVSFGRL